MQQQAETVGKAKPPPTGRYGRLVEKSDDMPPMVAEAASTTTAPFGLAPLARCLGVMAHTVIFAPRDDPGGAGNVVCIRNPRSGRDGGRGVAGRPASTAACPTSARFDDGASVGRCFDNAVSASRNHTLHVEAAR